MANRKAVKGRTRPQPNPRIQQAANERAQLQRLERAQREIRKLAKRVENGAEAMQADLLGMARRLLLNAGLVVWPGEYVGGLQQQVEALQRERDNLRATLDLKREDAIPAAR